MCVCVRHVYVCVLTDIIEFMSEQTHAPEPVILAMLWL